MAACLHCIMSVHWWKRKQSIYLHGTHFLCGNNVWRIKGQIDNRSPWENGYNLRDASSWKLSSRKNEAYSFSHLFLAQFFFSPTVSTLNYSHRNRGRGYRSSTRKHWSHLRNARHFRLRLVKTSHKNRIPVFDPIPRPCRPESLWLCTQPYTRVIARVKGSWTKAQQRRSKVLEPKFHTSPTSAHPVVPWIVGLAYATKLLKGRRRVGHGWSFFYDGFICWARTLLYFYVLIRFKSNLDL